MKNQYKITSKRYSVSYLLKHTDSLEKISNMAQNLNTGETIRVLKNGYPFIVLIKDINGVKVRLSK